MTPAPTYSQGTVADQLGAQPSQIGLPIPKITTNVSSVSSSVAIKSSNILTRGSLYRRKKRTVKWSVDLLLFGTMLTVLQLLATAVQDPGKPKLVQIQHPLQAPAVKSLDRERTFPRTPELHGMETSGFSLYDIPLKQSDITGALQETHTGPRASLIPAPLSFVMPSRDEMIDSGIFMPSEAKRECSCLSMPQRAHSWSLLTQTESIPESLASSQMSITSEAIAGAIEHWATETLLLRSPLLIDLGHRNESDEKHITCLRKIFPGTSELLLSSLAAWLILDLYISKIKTIRAASTSKALAPTHNKVRAALGDCATSPAYQESRFDREVEAVHGNVDVIGQKLLITIRGNFDADLWTSLRVLVEVVEAVVN